MFRFYIFFNEIIGFVSNNDYPLAYATGLFRHETKLRINPAQLRSTHLQQNNHISKSRITAEHFVVNSFAVHFGAIFPANLIDFKRQSCVKCTTLINRKLSRRRKSSRFTPVFFLLFSLFSIGTSLSR